MKTKKTSSQPADKKDRKTRGEYVRELEALKIEITNLSRCIEDLKSQILNHREEIDHRDEELLRKSQTINRLIQFIQISLKSRGLKKASDLLKVVAEITAPKQPRKKARSR